MNPLVSLALDALELRGVVGIPVGLGLLIATAGGHR